MKKRRWGKERKGVMGERMEDKKKGREQVEAIQRGGQQWKSRIVSW